MSDDLTPFLEKRDDPVLSADFKFETDELYIFRFIVRSYFKERPKSGAAAFLKSVSQFFVEDLSNYYILGVTLDKLKPFQAVKVHNDSYAVATTDRSILTDEGTWALDIVVRPAIDERAWTNPSRWSDKVAAALHGWAGYRPVVDVVGVVTLPIRWYMSDTPHFDHVYAWWNRRQPVYFVQACTKEQLTDPNFKGKCPSVTVTPFNAVSFQKGLVGEDGLGFSAGLADYPDVLQPINIKDAAGSSGNVQVPIPGGTDTARPGSSSANGDGSQPKDKTEQYVIFGAFAALGYVLYKQVLKDVF